MTTDNKLSAALARAMGIIDGLRTFAPATMQDFIDRELANLQAALDAHNAERVENFRGAVDAARGIERERTK